jgi:hypothetical protein
MNNLQGLTYEPGSEIRKLRRSPANNRAAACRALNRLAREEEADAAPRRRARHISTLCRNSAPSPDNPDLLRDLGLCCVNLGQLKKCIQLLHHSLTLENVRGLLSCS